MYDVEPVAVLAVALRTSFWLQHVHFRMKWNRSGKSWIPFKFLYSLIRYKKDVLTFCCRRPVKSSCPWWMNSGKRIFWPHTTRRDKLCCLLMVWSANEGVSMEACSRCCNQLCLLRTTVLDMWRFRYLFCNSSRFVVAMIAGHHCIGLSGKHFINFS